MWHYVENGKTAGPVTDKQLKAMADEGVIGPDDKINKAGNSEWMPASKVRGLFLTTANSPNKQKRLKSISMMREFAKIVGILSTLLTIYCLVMIKDSGSFVFFATQIIGSCVGILLICSVVCLLAEIAESSVSSTK